MPSSTKILVALFVLLCLAACNNNTPDSTVTDADNPPPPSISYRMVKEYPHDTTFFTEGLIWHNNAMYESAGETGESRLVKTDLSSGKVEQKITLPADDFGEGIAIIGDSIYQLTYKNNRAYVYSLSTFKKGREVAFPYEGWGMTTNGKDLIMSIGGSSNLYFVNPVTFKVSNILSVTDNYGPVSSINELEYVNGYVFANVWHTNKIIKIDPASGRVAGVIDVGDILTQAGKPINYADSNNAEKVLNGIAYDSLKNSFYITGKRWPLLFEIKLN